MNRLVSTILENLKNVRRSDSTNSVMAVDHCFSIKGKGTVFTGTVTKGSFKVGQNFEIPEFGLERAIKSIQCFKKQMKEVRQGDRAAFMVAPLKSDEIERCLLTTPGYLKKIGGVITTVEVCKYFKGSIKSKGKFHISIGHLNIMADVFLFLSKENDEDTSKIMSTISNFRLNELNEKDYLFDLSREYELVNEIDKDRIKLAKRELTHTDLQEKKQFVMAYLKFQKPLFIVPYSFYIGARFDFQTEKKNCRIAFSGVTLASFQESVEAYVPPALKLVTDKKKAGIIEKFFDDYTVIIKDMFKKETNLGLFMNKDVFVDESELKGKMTASFGSSGKVKVVFAENVKEKYPDLIGKPVHIINKKYQKLI